MKSYNIRKDMTRSIKKAKPQGINKKISFVLGVGLVLVICVFIAKQFLFSRVASLFSPIQSHAPASIKPKPTTCPDCQVVEILPSGQAKDISSLPKNERDEIAQGFKENQLRINKIEETTKKCKNLFYNSSLAEMPQKRPYGEITGPVTYPSDFIPPDMIICALAVGKNVRYCTKNWSKNYKFDLRVPPGSYYLAKMFDLFFQKGDGIDFVGIYGGQQIYLGMNVTFFKKINIIDGQIISNIDPQSYTPDLTCSEFQ